MKPINEQTELELTETVELLIERVDNDSLWHVLKPLVECAATELKFEKCKYSNGQRGEMLTIQQHAISLLLRIECAKNERWGTYDFDPELKVQLSHHKESLENLLSCLSRILK